MKKNNNLLYTILLGIALIPIIGIVLNPTVIDDLKFLDLLSGFSVRIAYISLISIFSFYLLYRVIYTESADQRRLIKVSILNFIINMSHLSLLISGGLYLISRLDIALSSTTGMIITVTFLVTSISVMVFELDLYKTRKNFKLEKQIEQANQKSITTSILLHALILISLTTLATTSQQIRNDSVIGSALLIWDSFYVTTLQPLIIPKLTK